MTEVHSSNVPFEIFDHTTDVGLVSYGKTLPALFENAASGMMTLVLNPEDVSPGGIREKVKVSAADTGNLLVAWLNEIIFLFTVQNMALCQFQIQSFSPTELIAEVGGELLDPERHHILREIRSASSYDLQIEKTESGQHRARIILDV